MAVVLEPEVPLRQALQMGPVMMVAAIDCLGTLLPPHSAVLVRWPDKIVLNLGEVGRIELGAATARDDEVPAWLSSASRSPSSIPIAPTSRGRRRTSLRCTRKAAVI